MRARKVEATPDSKICKGCGEDKSLDEFSPLKNGRYGRYPRCRTCRNASNYKKWHGDMEYVYALVCPTSAVIWYVGRSANPRLRLRSHIADAKCSPHANPRKAKWILDLLEARQEPRVIVIEECTPDEVAERELYWINHHRAINPGLLNGHTPDDLKRRGKYERNK